MSPTLMTVGSLTSPTGLPSNATARPRKSFMTIVKGRVCSVVKWVGSAMGLLLVLRFTGDDFHGWGGNKNGEVFPELRKIVPSFGGYKTGNDDEEVSDIHFGASLLTLDK